MLVYQRVLSTKKGISDLPHVRGTGVPLPATPDVGGRTGPLPSLLWSVDLWRKEFLRHQVGMGRIAGPEL